MTRESVHDMGALMALRTMRERAEYLTARADALRKDAEQYERGSADQRAEALRLAAELVAYGKEPLTITAEAAGVDPDHLRTEVAALIARRNGEAAAPVTGVTAEEPTQIPGRLAPRLAPDAPLVHAERVTRARVGRLTGRRTMFVHIGRGEFVMTDTRQGWTRPGGVTLPVLLGEMLRVRAERGYLCDGPDWCLIPGETREASVRAWMTQDIPGWRSLGMYVPMPVHGQDQRDARTPVGRWLHVESGFQVELHRAGTWFGAAGEYSPRAAAAAWAALGAIVAAEFRGGCLLATPATTGRDLWLRTVPAGKEIPVMSDELQELIRSTAGQGRRELFPHPDGAAEIPGIYHYDGRLMYAGLVFGMPWGPPTRLSARMIAALSDEELDKAMLGPSRWLVTATVPQGWDHVGVLMAPDHQERGWYWPNEPGLTFATWADGREVEIARAVGWQLTLHEAITWREGKLLDTWAKKLVTAADRVEQTLATETDPGAGEMLRMVRAGLRNMIIYGIGAFASRSHPVVHSVPVDRPELADPDGRAVDGVHVQGDSLVWVEHRPLPSWSADMAHPEWSAAIWGRARARLLDGPNGLRGPDGVPERVGALHIPRVDVVAFATDAMYLSADPGWQSSGRAGHYRLKGRLPGPVPYPGSWATLLRYRDQMTE